MSNKAALASAARNRCSAPITQSAKINDAETDRSFGEYPLQDQDVSSKIVTNKGFGEDTLFNENDSLQPIVVGDRLMFSIYDVVKIHEKKMLQNESSVQIVQKDVERIDEQMASCIHDLDGKIESLYSTLGKHPNSDNGCSDKKVEELSTSLTKRQNEYESNMQRLSDELENISKSSRSLHTISTEVNVTLLRIQTKVTVIEDDMIEFKTALASLREEVNALKEVDVCAGNGSGGIESEEREVSECSVSDRGGQTPCPSPVGVCAGNGSGGIESEEREVSVGEVSVEDVSVGEVSVEDVSVGEVSVEDVSVGEVDTKAAASVGEVDTNISGALDKSERK